MIIIIATHRPCHTVTNLLICNTSAFVASFQINSLIASVYGFLPESSYHQPLCSFRVFWLLASITGTCYSYAIQSISRLFFAVFYKYKYLVTFRVHWYMVILSWILSISVTVISLASPDLFGLDPQMRRCVIKVSLLKLTVPGVVGGIVLPLCVMISVYGVILHHAYKSSRQINSLATHTQSLHTPNAKREAKLAKNILMLVGIFGSGGVIFVLIIVWQLIAPRHPPPIELHLFSITATVISCAAMMVVLFMMNKDVKDILLHGCRTVLQSTYPAPATQRITFISTRK